jgi:hypothetical protein
MGVERIARDATRGNQLCLGIAIRVHWLPLNDPSVSVRRLTPTCREGSQTMLNCPFTSVTDIGKVAFPQTDASPRSNVDVPRYTPSYPALAAIATPIMAAQARPPAVSPLERRVITERPVRQFTCTALIPTSVSLPQRLREIETIGNPVIVPVQRYSGEAQALRALPPAFAWPSPGQALKPARWLCPPGPPPKAQPPGSSPGQTFGIPNLKGWVPSALRLAESRGGTFGGVWGETPPTKRLRSG